MAHVCGLFITLFYHGFISFIKVKGKDAAQSGCASKVPFQETCWSRPGIEGSRKMCEWQ